MVSDSRANPSRRAQGRAPAARRRSGFTLLEVMLATVIVGTAVLSIVAAQQAYHQHNDISQRMGTALLLANEIRELTLNLPQKDPISGDAVWGPESNETSFLNYDDLDDFDGPSGEGLTISPPIDAGRTVVPDLDGWSQVVTVENVLPNFVNGSAAPDNSTKVVRITCRILYQKPRADEPFEVTRMTWIRAGGS